MVIDRRIRKEMLQNSDYTQIKRSKVTSEELYKSAAEKKSTSDLEKKANCSEIYAE